MTAVISSKEVEATIRSYLASRSYRLSLARNHGETGADIIATKGDDTILIEAIAFKSSPPARSKDFYESFFRAVSRIRSAKTRCVIALPARFGMGLSQRAKAIGLAWLRIGDSFPELEIWLVDTENETIRETTWSEWHDQGSI